MTRTAREGRSALFGARAVTKRDRPATLRIWADDRGRAVPADFDGSGDATTGRWVMELGKGAGDRVVGRRTGRTDGERQRGATLVEFALIAPLLFALLLGAITGGLALSRKNSMTNAAREGARLGATLPAEGTWAADVRDRVADLSAGDVTVGQICVALVVKVSDADTEGTDVLATTCTLDTTEYPEPPLPAGVLVGECVVKV